MRYVHCKFMIAYLQGLCLLRSSRARMATDSLLEQLPNEVLETVLAFLDPQTLVRLHAATATRMSTVRHRLNATRCGWHWLQLSRRVPPLIGTAALAAYRVREAARLVADRMLGPQPFAEGTDSEVSEVASQAASQAASEATSDFGSSQAASAMSMDDVEDAEAELSAASSAATDIDALASSDADSVDWSQNETADLAAKQLSWRPCSKHSLLRSLCDQIQHINDVAAFMYYWTECTHFDWGDQLEALGLAAQQYDAWTSGLGCNGIRCRLSSLERAIQQAFLLGWDGFVDFNHDKDHAANKWQEFMGFKPNDVQQEFKFKDQLVFMCVLYQLQQLPAQVVLARLHGMLSRCCRCDLLVLSEVLQLEWRNQMRLQLYDVSREEEPESDVLSAFGQSEPAVAGVLSALTHEQRCSIVSCVKDMVDRYVARSKWYGPLEFLCHGC